MSKILQFLVCKFRFSIFHCINFIFQADPTSLLSLPQSSPLLSTTIHKEPTAGMTFFFIIFFLQVYTLSYTTWSITVKPLIFGIPEKTVPPENLLFFRISPVHLETNKAWAFQPKTRTSGCSSQHDCFDCAALQSLTLSVFCLHCLFQAFSVLCDFFH